MDWSKLQNYKSRSLLHEKGRVDGVVIWLAKVVVGMKAYMVMITGWI